MTWGMVGAAAVTVVGGAIASHNAAKSTGTSSGQSGFDPNIQQGTNQVIQTAEQVANQPFQYYDPNQAVVGMDPNQTAAWGGANADAQYLPQFEKTAGQAFTPDTIQKYSNPYTQQVLDAQNAMATRNYQTEMAGLQSKEGMSNAFGGDRSALAESNLTTNFNLQSDIRNKQGLSDAYNAGVSAFNQDRGYAAGQVGAIEGQLSATGGVAQNVGQQRANFSYNQFTQARDWTKNQNAYLAQMLGQVPKGSWYSGNQTSSYQPAGGGWGGAIAGAAGILAKGGFGGGSTPSTPDPNNSGDMTNGVYNGGAFGGGAPLYDPSTGGYPGDNSGGAAPSFQYQLPVQE